MNHQHELGELLFSATPALGTRLKRAILPLIIGLALLVLAILAIVDPVFMGLRDDEAYIPWIILTAGLVLFGVGIVLGLRIKSIFIYEKGVQIDPGPKEQQFLYEETSVVDYITKQSVNFIPAGKTHTVTLHKFENIDGHSLDSFDFTMAGIPQRKKTVAALLDAHADFWINCINQANVSNLNIRFCLRGKLILRNGRFTFNQGRRKGDAVFSLNQITGLTSSHGLIRILGGVDAKGRDETLASISSTNMLNLPVLTHIINTAMGNQDN